MIRFFGPALILMTLSCQGEFLEESDKYRPTDHLYWQRAYPDSKFDLKGWRNEFSRIRETEQKSFARNSGQWETQGPGNLGARINSIAVHPQDYNIILIGYSAGGIYKTVDGGISWYPVFDDFPVMAIGDIVYDQADPDIVYVGTGDPNISGIPFAGDGIYRSLDGGDSWSYLGLKEAGIIAEIIIDSTNPSILYAASMGIPFYRDDNRGLYKSINGGSSWEKILFLGNGTGVIDVAMSPDDPMILYAAGWDRIRNYEESTTDGEGARIYKSTNAGASWTQLDGGLPNKVHSRIGIEVSPSNPDKLYAVYVDLDYELEEIYSSSDAGEKWSTIPTNSSSGLGTATFGGFGWYFGKIRVHPDNENSLYLLGVRLWRYNGNTRRWNRVDQFTRDEVHADKHDLWFVNGDTLLLATDGGLYRSVDDAASWTDIEDIPTTQIYRVTYNPHFPDMYYAGAQDNGSSFGNKDMLTQWVQYFQGDGFRTLFHPDDPMIFYVETQSGGLSVTTNGGGSFSRATNGINSSDNINWDAPVIMSRFNADVLYYGTDRVYRSSTGADENFAPISPRLTDDVVKLDATSNISALEESPFDAQILLAGTGDGNLYRTTNGGGDWEKIDLGLPDRYITSIAHSLDFDSVLYVTHSGYKSGEKLAHVHRSDDLGKTWNDISGDLPSLPVNDILILENNEDKVLFVATDAGVYFTRDAGGHWLRLGSNMPLVPVFDLAYNIEHNAIIAGTHAKSIMTYALDQEGLDTELHVSINDKNFGNLVIQPNPVSDYLSLKNIELSTGTHHLIIVSLTGQIVRQAKLRSQEIDVHTLQPGAYQIMISNGSEWSTGKFIKI